MSPSLLSAHEVATLLGVRPATVYALCRRGELVHIRLTENRRRPLIRFRREDIERMLDSRTVGVAEAPADTATTPAPAERS